MLVFCLSTDYYLFNFGILFVGYTYYIIKELLIEPFWGWDIFNSIFNKDFPYNSIQRYIVSLKGFTVGFTKDKPTAIILLQILWMEKQFKWLLTISLIGKAQDLLICNSLVEYR